MEPTNSFEAVARTRKVSAPLLQCVREGIGPDDLAAWGNDEWELLAQRAGTHSPSQVTRALVVDAVERDAQRTPATDDPFVGLAS